MSSPTGIHRPPASTRVGIVGLGYVGLPLAVALSAHFDVVGYDIDGGRVEELHNGRDRTNEVEASRLTASSVRLTSEVDALRDRDILIVTVPTPVDDAKQPDLGPVRRASQTVGAVVKKGAIVVFESTVYPGVTEDICGPIIAAESGREIGTDIILGYSPERINPGDKVHTVDKINKVVAAQTPEAAQLLAGLYGAMNGDQIFLAKDIRTAEASKVIENAQRDINIAFVNEIAVIFERMGLSVHDVLEAARSKWNFLDFRPGLVGGHCIGVDPYYLAHAAKEAGCEPRVILSGRRINDAMGATIADRIGAMIDPASSVLVLGITFKEDVPDIRNSRVIDVIRALESQGHRVSVCDPIADAEEAAAEYGVAPVRAPHGRFDCVVGAVNHAAFADFDLTAVIRPGGLVADIKGIWRDRPSFPGLRYWSL
ncbi:MAG: nucleotide sugar dehydrogenase [Alphaproteobacteria bacterium]|nr:nucleotide sugar dehydrogenase [Alphaproteobacteria bacterium]